MHNAAVVRVFVACHSGEGEGRRGEGGNFVCTHARISVRCTPRACLRINSIFWMSGAKASSAPLQNSTCIRARGTQWAEGVRGTQWAEGVRTFTRAWWTASTSSCLSVVIVTSLDEKETDVCTKHVHTTHTHTLASTTPWLAHASPRPFAHPGVRGAGWSSPPSTVAKESRDRANDVLCAYLCGR